MDCMASSNIPTQMQKLLSRLSEELELESYIDASPRKSAVFPGHYDNWHIFQACCETQRPARVRSKHTAMYREPVSSITALQLPNVLIWANAACTHSFKLMYGRSFASGTNADPQCLAGAIIPSNVYSQALARYERRRVGPERKGVQRKSWRASRPKKV